MSSQFSSRIKLLLFRGAVQSFSSVLEGFACIEYEGYRFNRCLHHVSFQMQFLVMFLLVSFLGVASAEEIFKFTVQEKSPIDTLIADLSNQLLIKTAASYSLQELIPTQGNFVSINNRTGQVRTRSLLDREEMCAKQQCSCQSCELPFQLLVINEQAIISKVIEIKVEDRNDHSPRFENQSMIHIIHIKENVPLGHRIVLPTANDPDEGMFIDLRCIQP